VTLDPAAPTLVDLELDQVMQVSGERPAVALGELRNFFGMARDRGQLEPTQEHRERLGRRERDGRGHAATSGNSAS
jgi:hypothetical protein